MGVDVTASTQPRWELVGQKDKDAHPLGTLFKEPRSGHPGITLSFSLVFSLLSCQHGGKGSSSVVREMTSTRKS